LKTVVLEVLRLPQAFLVGVPEVNTVGLFLGVICLLRELLLSHSVGLWDVLGQCLDIDLISLFRPYL
jgi:hypothetical protein